IARAEQPVSRLEPALGARPERRPPATGSESNVRSLFRRKGFIAALVGGMAAAAAIGAFVVNKSDKTEPQVATLEGAWGGTVASVSRASADGGSGFEVCKDKCEPAVAGAAIEAGSTLKTDGKTRARVKLADDTWIALDRDTEITLPAGKTRQAKIGKGLVVADVKKVDGIEPAKLILPQGEVVVSGTKVAATVTDRRAAIEVVRGDAEVTSKAGVTSKLRAGEEATIAGDGEPVIAAKATMSDVLEWSSESADDVDAPALKGLGELRARKPGSKDEKVGAVRLTKHAVKVRVVDVIARTEIDETFTNQTDEELEGIFRFPLPPGAQIENLALEVDGKMIDGAFVDRDKGAAIWRGVIQNAAPKTPKPREEIIWVAGPWRDPALLEWQRGGRFELRIFPIPKKGSRRVKLTYTEPVNQSGGVRRFTYPLAHDASGSTKIDDFNIDLQILGNDSQFGVETRGYQLAKADATGGAERFTLSERNFVPAGDLTVEYALPDRSSALSWWAYDMPPQTQQASAQTVSGPAVAKAPVLASAGQNAAQKAKDAAIEAKALADDGSPYVALAVRPKLPRFPEGKDRLHVIVVDSSRSMVGERFARATRLAAGMVREMDRRDQFMVLACDITCQAMGATDGRTIPLPSEPSAEAAGQVESFLGSIEPDGGSNMLAAVKAARAAAGASGRELRVIYLGDGTPTVGPTKAASLESAVRHELPSGQGSVIAVALGSDADTTSLAAMARGGNGVLVPYVPGQRVGAASVDVLAAAYGSILSDVEVVLPVGLTEVTPKRLDPIPAGGEAFILARMTGGKQVSGDVVLRGKVGSERFEKKWEAKVVASSKAGNAFVPRLFAAAKIAELEQLGLADDREKVVALSKQFNVASRHTSMIVLESEAMFKAFGLDKNGIGTVFTGEDQAQSSSSEADGDSATDDALAKEEEDEFSRSKDKKRDA
ncbi:MAG: FecR domain-containing protein, partial [Myxococcales bacterium]|nr:FecR domain-containing protein [Myxococcales bacterium]